MLTSLTPFSKHPSQTVYEESTTVIRKRVMNE